MKEAIRAVERDREVPKACTTCGGSGRVRAASGFFSIERTCPTCQGLGYQGRVGVYEVLRLNETLASAIAQRASTDRIRKLAIDSGMKTLLGYGLELVRQGLTTLEEIERMILTDASLESERRVKALHTITCRGCGGGMHDDWLECPYCLTPRGIH
jgi:type IV pilus assembly protein PilB